MVVEKNTVTVFLGEILPYCSFNINNHVRKFLLIIPMPYKLKQANIPTLRANSGNDVL
jgi:hypothetical protein